MDGKKKGCSDVPCVFPLLPQSKCRKAPKLRESLQPPKKRRVVELLPQPLPDALVDEVICLCTFISNSYEQRENVDLEKRLRRSISVERFGLQRFAGSDDIKFDTEFSGYNTFSLLL